MRDFLVVFKHASCLDRADTLLVRSITQRIMLHYIANYEIGVGLLNDKFSSESLSVFE
jgi:hypothetical protein